MNKKKLFKINDISIITLPSHSSVAVGTQTSGSLVVAEIGKQIPYPIARIFFVFGLRKGEVRGDHAHRACKQILVALQGAIEVRCTDGENEKTYLLDSPTQALLIPESLWASQKYVGDDSVLLVIADLPFSEQDYIRNYPIYLRYRKGEV